MSHQVCQACADKCGQLVGASGAVSGVVAAPQVLCGALPVGYLKAVRSNDWCVFAKAWGPQGSRSQQCNSTTACMEAFPNQVVTLRVEGRVGCGGGRVGWGERGGRGHSKVQRGIC